MARTPRPLRERRVFVDSSAYLALLDQDDEHHEGATSILRQLAVGRYRQFTTNVIRIEAQALVLSALGIAKAAQFLRETLESKTALIRVRAQDETRAELH